MGLIVGVTIGCVVVVIIIIIIVIIYRNATRWAPIAYRAPEPQIDPNISNQYLPGISMALPPIRARIAPAGYMGPLAPIPNKRLVDDGVWKDTQKILYDYQCAICLDEVNEVPLVSLSCNHIFHMNCILEWR